MKINPSIPQNTPIPAASNASQPQPLATELQSTWQCEQPKADTLQSSALNQGQALAVLCLDTQTNPKIDAYLKQLDPFMAKGRLSMKEKRQVMKIMHTAKKEGDLPDLAKTMDEKKMLSSLYHKMRIPHKPNDGRFALPIQLSGGGTFVLTQDNFPNYSPDTDFEDRSEDFKKLLKKGNVAPEILNKLY